MPLPIVGGIIAAAVAALSRLVMSRAGMWIAAGLLALGIELAVTGATVLPFVDDVSDAMNGIPSEIGAWMGVLNIDIYVSCVVSALVISAVRSAIRIRRRAA